MNPTRRLIVNADDFGLSPGVNRGIVAAHERGIVTSASLIVRAPAADEAAAYARVHPRLSVGLHVDLGEWAFRGGAWVELYRVVDLEDDAAVEAEVARQLDRFRGLVGRDPTHLDSHQHVHRRGAARRVVTAAGERLGVAVRHETPGVIHCGDFYGQDGEGHPYPHLISADALIAVLGRLRAGVTELGCHPGEAELPDTMYVAERADEVRTMCDLRVRRAVQSLGIELISFHDLPCPAPAGRGEGRRATP
jgi:predicted glycoside hydrolase/deacetylase ChbG (UPF0249 family)